MTSPAAGDGAIPPAGVSPRDGNEPSAADGETEAHARAARPEDLPRLFVEAWNYRDPAHRPGVLIGIAAAFGATSMPLASQ